jgi:hypothetical protein
MKDEVLGRKLDRYSVTTESRSEAELGSSKSISISAEMSHKALPATLLWPSFG